MSFAQSTLLKINTAKYAKNIEFPHCIYVFLLEPSLKER